MAYKKILLEGDAALLTSTQTPIVVDGGAAAIGSGSEASKADHKHGFTHPSITSGDHHTEYLKADGTRALSGNLDVNLNQLVEAVAEGVASLPGGVTNGRVVYLTTDNHLYVGTP